VDPFSFLQSGEVPDEAQQLIDRFERSAKKARSAVDRQAATIRARAEEEAEKIRQAAEKEIDGIQQAAEETVQAQAEALAREVQGLLDGYLREGRLGEVLAVAARLRGLRTSTGEVLPDPGYVHINKTDFGKTFLYEVTGATDLESADIYGTDVYSGDSQLAAACVHAGVLRPGEKGVVRVMILSKPHPSFQGSTRHGVTSQHWDGAFPGFRVSAG
jgi:hypothetical protein